MPEPGELRTTLQRLLEAAGYETEDRPTGVRAVRRSDSRAVLIVEGDRSPVELDFDLPKDLAHRTLVYSEDPGSAARTAASDRGLEVLDARSLGPGLGELLLPPLPPARSEGRPAGIEPPPILVPEGERIVRPRLGRHDAEALAAVEGFRCTLRLVPYYLAPYRVRLSAPHGAPSAPVGDQLVVVNGLSGDVEVWTPGDRELVAELEESHQRLEPAISAPRARDRALTYLRQRHTTTVDHTEQHGGALVIERRRIPPGPDDLRIGDAVVVHVPFWYVEGATGRVVLDAVTGHRVHPEDPDLAEPG